METSNQKIALLFSIAFFIVGIFTLPHYGINWDTINHLPRGQAYLNYFLTGHKNYDNLLKNNIYWQNPDSLLVDTNIPNNEFTRRSFYQNDAINFNWIMQYQAGGHPPLSDLLSSVFNYALFQKLGAINDIDAYRVYSIFLAASLVGLIYYWTALKYGILAGLVAALSLALYPLFWSEAHFNSEKDIPETVFLSFSFFFFSQGVIKEKWKLIMVSGLFGGFALGTKFNALFAPFIALPWLLVFWWNGMKSKKLNILSWVKDKRGLLLAMSGGMFVAVAIFIISWPYLWSNTWEHMTKVMGFYKDIGLTKVINKDFVGPFNTNTYPIMWIIYTTPPIILFLSFVGVLSLPKRIKEEKEKIALLLLFWLIIPILRVTLPGTTIYGGVRQIMEYIPPFAMLSGIGASTLISFSRLKLYKYLIILGLCLSFLLTFGRLAAIHPNENVYFNFIIGGLKGAKEKNIPSWGNSFGAAYRQGISWINKNAEPGSRLALASGLMPNIPRIWVRSDLDYSNTYRSGYLRQGEYAINLVYEGVEDRTYYEGYLEKFINPVFEVKVDGVAILKVWKNDEAHLKQPWQEQIIENVTLEKNQKSLRFDVGDVVKVSRLEIEYDEASCVELESLYVRISPDGENWGNLPEKLPTSWRIAVLGKQPADGKFIEPFIGEKIRYIDLVISPQDTCLKKIKSFKLYRFL